MRPDGTYPFVNTDRVRELARKFSGGAYDSLGEDNSTSLGTCVQAAMPILQYAQLSGNDKYVAAGLKALEAMKQFRIPRGAQVWEVHQEIPDIRAAALAVEACHIGYQLTGDEGWLDDASYWAYTGLPFIYSWHVPIEGKEGHLLASHAKDDRKLSAIPLAEAFENPDRQVTPYGTLPVLGTTFYVISWFGKPVQWCGLEWAWKVIELDADRPDPLLRYIADGVVASGLQQVFDKGPWVGLYPDSWVLEQNLASSALISIRLPMECLRSQGRIPTWTRSWTRVLHGDAGRRWHVSGWGRPLTLDRPGNLAFWSATVAFLPDQPNELIVAGIDRPKQVRIAGDVLKERAPGQDHATRSGWHYNAQRRALVSRFVQPVEETEIRVTW